ncbi:MAG: Flp pilus assembly protein CpaB [Patescibacteria group bacterium]|nr:Flp pilus assembly protein CpaB [Patescibacteria group bacterium]
MKISSGTLVLGVFAALFGLVGAYAAKQHLAEKPVAEKPAPTEQFVSVPMAAVNLPAGRTLSIGDMTVRQLTWNQIREMGLPREFMSNPSQLTGRILRANVTKGISFTPDDLYPVGTGPSVAERLKPGYRAVSVPLDNSIAEMTLLSPGALVDVMFRTFARGAMPETTVTLLEHVEILAIGDQAFPGGTVTAGAGGSGRSASVTLACTPDQASALKVIEGRGSLSLVLRGPEDDRLVGTSAPQTLETLLDLPAAKPPVMTHVYRRGQLTTSVFDEGGLLAVSESFSSVPISADTTRTHGVIPVSYVRAGSERAAAAAAERAAAAAPSGSAAGASGSGNAGCTTCGQNK